MGWASTVVAYLRWRTLGETQPATARQSQCAHSPSNHSFLGVDAPMQRQHIPVEVLVDRHRSLLRANRVAAEAGAEAQHRHLTRVQPRTSSKTRRRARAPTRTSPPFSTCGTGKQFLTSTTPPCTDPSSVPARKPGHLVRRRGAGRSPQTPPRQHAQSTAQRHTNDAGLALIAPHKVVQDGKQHHWLHLHLQRRASLQEQRVHGAHTTAGRAQRAGRGV